MILNEKTVGYLKSIAKVNESVFLKKGKRQTVVSPGKEAILSVELDDEIPNDFGIYNLGNLINIISLLTEPVISFDQNKLIVADSKGYRAVFHATNPALIININNFEEFLAVPTVFSFELSMEVLTTIVKLAKVNGLSHISFEDSPNAVIISAYTKKQKDSNTISINVPHEEKSQDQYFKNKFIIASNNLAIEPDFYEVSIAENGFAKFVSKTCSRIYIIATEYERK